MKEFEYDGLWWLPDNPKKMINGKLKFHPINGIELELYGLLGDNFKKTLNPNIILGITSDSKKITLRKCYELKKNLGGFIKSTFTSGFIFIGHHFIKEDEILFNNLSINYSYLNEWSEITGFEQEISMRSGKLKKISVHFGFPKEIEVKVNNLKICLTSSFRYNLDRFKKTSMEQTIFFKVTPKKPIHFDEYQRNIFYHIQNFLCLGTGLAIQPIVITGKNENCKFKLKEKYVYEDIFVYYQLPHSFELKKFIPFNSLFNFPDISNDFEKYLKNWFKKSEILKPVYDLYFGTFYNPTMYLEHKFLSLVQALESFHRRKYGGKYISDEEFDEILNKLRKGIPSEIKGSFRESVKNKIKYFNEFSLRKRLKNILSKHKGYLKMIISNKNQFIEDTVNTRNYLIHYDEKLKKKAKSDKDLYELTEILKTIIKICFLVELEFPEKLIKKLITK